MFLPKVNSKRLFIEKSNRGLLNIKCFRAQDDTYKVYALGFKTNSDKNSRTYYIDEIDLDSSKLVLTLINELLRSRYSNITFYCHNLGGYVIVFILKVLLEYNDNNPEDNYRVSTILKNDKIIKVKITKDKNTLVILDSFAMFAGKLIDLGKDFEVGTVKSHFPYKFSVTENLFYIGVNPSIDYYEGITSETYDDIYLSYWSFKDETLRYLNNDLFSLYEILIKANKQIFLDFNVHMTEFSTISALASNIFLKEFYNNNIPLINKPSIYKDIKQAYYGGITEVYKPRGFNLYYYDINSLYPYVSLQDMPGLICSKMTYYPDFQNINTLFGFFFCSIDAPLDSYLGLLPVRNKSGIYFPLGKWEGWYFSEKLKFAQDNGYKIRVLKGYVFNREANVFKNYVDKVYAIKASATNPSRRIMAKSLLNNLLGRFGINLEKPITEVMSKKTFNTKMLIHKIMSEKQISDDKHLVTYISKLDF